MEGLGQRSLLLQAAQDDVQQEALTRSRRSSDHGADAHRVLQATSSFGAYVVALQRKRRPHAVAEPDEPEVRPAVHAETAVEPEVEQSAGAASSSSSTSKVLELSQEECKPWETELRRPVEVFAQGATEKELNGQSEPRELLRCASRRDSELQLLVDAWRSRLEALLCAERRLAPEGAEHSDEVCRILAEPEDRSPILELSEQDRSPVLVTAPHGIYLLRDHHSPHAPENNTTEIAKTLATMLTGTYLVWSIKEIRRVQALVACVHNSDLSVNEVLDPRIRDPNYLMTSELKDNSWHQNVLGVADRWRMDKPSMLHVDVHGCLMPKWHEQGAHLTIGLGAMQVCAEASGDAAELSRIRAFGEDLKASMVEALCSWGLQPRQIPLVRVVVPDKNDTAHAKFSGAWVMEPDRHTQTQQAVSFAGFSHSIQLEMTKELRSMLVKDETKMKKFGYALQLAWVRSKQAFPPLVAKTGAETLQSPLREN